MKLPFKCLECNKSGFEPVQMVWIFHYKYPLCAKHKEIFGRSKATEEAIALYFALKQKQFPVELEHNDRGYKRVDIAIPGKVHIEVDGRHHYAKEQAIKDLYRNYYSWKQGIFTFHVPNSLIKDKKGFDCAVQTLSKICREYFQAS